MPWGNWTRPFIIIVAKMICEQSKEIYKAAAQEKERSQKIIQHSLLAVQKAKGVRNISIHPSFYNSL
jgi:hypothetical protein